jgi:quinol-cytochrome oxidoreductase complex cytochrome b subunit
MATEPEIFPHDPQKTYGLMAVVPAETRMADKGPDGTVFSFPVVALLEILLTLGTALATLGLSLLRNAPLEELANPAVTTNPAKAPWYFLGLQEMLEHMHPTLAGVIIPTLLVGFLLVLPYLDGDQAGAGIWFTSRRGRRIVGWTLSYSLILMPVLIALDNAFNLREALRGVAPNYVAQWLVPSAVLAIVVIAPVLALLLQARRSGRRATAREVALTLFTVMMGFALVLTVSGFFFRGPGFRLYWPWQMPDGYNPLNGL